LSNLSTKCDPKNPAAPVTNTRVPLTDSIFLIVTFPLPTDYGIPVGNEFFS
jgi:hypothetical protein